MDALFKAMEELKKDNRKSLVESYQQFQSQYEQYVKQDGYTPKSAQQINFGLPYKKDR